MAGLDKERAEQINKAFADKEIKAIFCAKAGYGSIRILPYLNRKEIRNNPKIFIGYSDITILLLYLQKVARMVVFHGPLVCGEIYEGMNRLTLNFLLKAVTKPNPLGRISFPGLKVFEQGKAKGILVGGNLSLIVKTLGTPYEIDTDNKILFLEDIGEDLEAIDGYFQQLKLAGKFKNIKGVVFGRMVNCFDYGGKKYRLRNLVRDLFSHLEIPILYGFPSGHFQKEKHKQVNLTLPLGVEVIVDTNKLSLIIDESAVI